MSSSKDSDVFIIIPVYNEGGILCETLIQVLKYGFIVVVVDDGSEPTAKPSIEKLAVHYLRHPVNLGQGAALQTGTGYALSMGAEHIIHFDGDGQHSPDEINRFVEVLRKDAADVVLGSRFMNKEDRKNVPRPRRLLLKGGIIINGFMTGLWLSDAHNGFRGLNRKAALCLTLEENRFAHATEILYKIRANRLRIKEIPTHVLYTPYSIKKGQSWFHAINIFIDLLLKRII